MNRISLDNYGFLTEPHFDVIHFLEGNVTMYFKLHISEFSLLFINYSNTKAICLNVYSDTTKNIILSLPLKNT